MMGQTMGRPSTEPSATRARSLPPLSHRTATGPPWTRRCHGCQPVQTTARFSLSCASLLGEGTVRSSNACHYV